MTLNQLKRIRWGVRLVLALGVAASIVANVLHAQPHLVSRVISAWSPLALLLTIELISRVPVHRRSLAVARWMATAVIAGIAAWVSYWHMAHVAARYGETGAAPYLLPFSVDGLIVVASICLVEIGGRLRDATAPAVEPTDEPGREPVAEPPADPWEYAVPVAAEPPAEPPAEPVRRPRRDASAKRTTPKSLTSAERVIAAHEREPDASHARVAELAGVSVATVKRYRPTGSPSAPDAAETPAAEPVADPAPDAAAEPTREPPAEPVSDRANGTLLHLARTGVTR